MLEHARQFIKLLLLTKQLRIITWSGKYKTGHGESYKKFWSAISILHSFLNTLRRGDADLRF